MHLYIIIAYCIIISIINITTTMFGHSSVRRLLGFAVMPFTSDKPRSSVAEMC
jgi:hypothetical protein